MMKLLHWARWELTRNKFGHALHSNRGYDFFCRYIWHHALEPEVLRCLLSHEWDGPIWDVGASLGRHARKIQEHRKVYAFEPNLALLPILAHNLVDCQNVIIVPLALTADGRTMKGTFHPNFMAPQTGPAVASISIRQALCQFGRPGVVKIDIEGGEYGLLESPDIVGLNLVVEWHRGIPKTLAHWNIVSLDAMHSWLAPK
jgi:FkbM family methyltransferase